MGWQDRDWARWTDGERDRFLGRGSSRPPRSSRRRRSGSVWTRDLSARELVFVLVALVGIATLLAKLDGARSAVPGGGGIPLPLIPIGPEPGGPWPEGVIRYYNAAKQHRWAVQQAVDAWNASGARVRFVATTRVAAQLVIQSSPDRPCGHGVATLGYAPHATVTLFEPSPTRGCDRFSAARVAAHELGHVLGLDHDDRTCAAMNSAGNYGGPSQCLQSEPWRWRCRLLEPTDVAVAVGLYGGEPAPVRQRPMCSLYARLQAPGAVRLLHGRSSAGQLALAFVRPPDAVVPALLGEGGEASFAYAYDRGDCPGAGQVERYRWSVGPGQEQLVFRPILGRGVHCFRVWAFDRFGRRSGSASTIRVNVR